MDSASPAEFQRVVDRARRRDREQIQRDLDAIQQIGIHSFEQLLARLSALDAAQLPVALAALVHFGRRKAVPPLLQLLKRPEPGVRISVLQSLSEVGGDRAFKTLATMTHEDADAEVRVAACYYLRNLFDERAWEPLLRVLQDAEEEPRVRGMAAEGLGFSLERGDRRTRRIRQTVPALIEALRDSSPEVRFWAAYALGAMRVPSALPELKRLAETDDTLYPGWWRVGEEASDAIEWIHGRETPDRERTLTAPSEPNSGS